MKQKFQSSEMRGKNKVPGITELSTVTFPPTDSWPPWSQPALNYPAVLLVFVMCYGWPSGKTGIFCRSYETLFHAKPFQKKPMLA